MGKNKRKMVNYKKLYYEEKIEQVKHEKFIGWFFLSCFLLFTPLLWIFGVEELWSIKDKVIATFFLVIMGYVSGYLKIKAANLKIRNLEGERKK